MAFVTHLTFVNISIIIQILLCVKSIYDIVSIYFWYVKMGLKSKKALPFSFILFRLRPPLRCAELAFAE